jgi:N-acetylmuramoyl-L-alanine amidase
LRDAIPAWLRSGKKWVASLSLACLLLISFSTLLLSNPADDNRISIYSKVANYSLPVLERNKLEYVGLLETLEPLGAVSARASGKSWKLRYKEVECGFTAGKKQAGIGNSGFDLSANFLLENGRGLVPLSGLPSLLSRILGGPVTLNQSARRLFVGNVAVHFTAQVSGAATPGLVMNFTSPVNPTIATEPGKLRMVFTRDAVVAPGSQTLTFNSKLIPSATFVENNGTAEIVVHATSPVLATFGNDGRTITIAPPSNPTTQNPVPLPGTPLPGVSSSTARPSPPATPQYAVIIDAAHGGTERGAVLSDQLAEKDVTLALARTLRHQLEVRGFSARLLRDGDSTLTADQRAGMTNSSEPAIYVCLHATSQGRGVRLYTAVASATATNKGPFVDWNGAQAPFSILSRLAEDSVATELRNKQVPVRELAAALRPLTNIAAAATAIEVASTSGDVNQLNASAYQELVMGAVAGGIANIRERLLAQRK